MKSCLLGFFLLMGSTILFGQEKSIDSLKFDYDKIYSLCLDANTKPVLKLLENIDNKLINIADSQFKKEFECRFGDVVDKCSFLSEKNSQINGLFEIFHRYWRASLLEREKDCTPLFLAEVKTFVLVNYPQARSNSLNLDSLDRYLKNFIESKGYHTVSGLGKVGKLYDLLVWKSEKDTVYTFKIMNESFEVNVVFMEDFITLGWEEYATLGKHYPGGWATKDALYCVKKAYDLKSENFLIGYLAHEGRHFSDYKIFPNLKNADLEYRAILTELCMAKTNLYGNIKFFINNANYNSENGHSIGNYCAIRDLSRSIFGVDFEKDMNKWRNINSDVINNAAYLILQHNTEALLAIGHDVESYIK